MQFTFWIITSRTRCPTESEPAMTCLSSRDRKAPALAIAAPPRTLADLRTALDPDVRAKVVLEINKDLTRMPVWAIEKHVVEALAHA